MPSKKIGLIAVLILILALCLGAFALLSKDKPQEPNNLTLKEATTDATKNELPAYTIDFTAAKRERTLGNRNAPVKISEHSSFTCGHCGNFHKQTFAQFKAEWIDTQKAYLVFSDFPLNGPALHASMIARCTPEDRYFEFVNELFAKQEEWAFERNYLDILKKYAHTYGLSKENVETCLKNEDLQKTILDRVRGNQAQFGINSTPSFVVNNTTTIIGSLDYESFNKTIEEALNPAPPAAEAAAEEGAATE
ncbi:MAG: DsbA family protein [Alphaproteobacteria bacterium]